MDEKRAVIYIRALPETRPEELLVRLASAVAAAQRENALVSNIFSDEGKPNEPVQSRAGLTAALAQIESGRASILITEGVAPSALEGVAPSTPEGVRSVVAQIRDRVHAAGAKIVDVDPAEPHPAPKRPFRKISEGLRAQALSGRQPQRGHAPFGYRIITKKLVMSGRYPETLLGTYLVDQGEAHTVRNIFDEYLRVGSASAVALILNRSGNQSPSGKPWSATVVSRILDNTAYVGRAVWGRTRSVRDDARLARGLDAEIQVARDPQERIEIPCPRIIDDETFSRVAKAREANRRPNRLVAHPVGRSRNLRLLSSLLACGDCGSRMTYGSYVPNPKRNRKGGHYYACRNCKPTWNAESPRPKLCAYPGAAVEDAVRCALLPIVPEEDRPMVEEVLFAPTWPITIKQRREILVRAKLSAFIWNNPFKATLGFAFVEGSDLDFLGKQIGRSVRLFAANYIRADEYKDAERRRQPRPLTLHGA